MTQTTNLQTLAQQALQQVGTWQLSFDAVAQLLGVAAEIKPRQLPDYLKGERALPETPELRERLEHMVGITEALATTYPFSEQMRVMWLRKPHRRFQGRTPLAVMLEEGVEGLQKVRMDVDCAYSYAITDALQAAQKSAN